MTKIKIVLGDITQQDTDIVVNTTNEELAWEELAVNGSFHTECGPEYTRLLSIRYRQYGILHKGDVYRTESFSLPSKHIFHIMAPTVNEDNADCIMKNVYQSCFRRMKQIQVSKMDIGKARSISFPAIGAGAFMWPINRTSTIAMSSILSMWTPEYSDMIDEIRFVMYSTEDLEVYKRLYGLHKEFLNNVGVE